ncbi:MAG: maleylpyruvate isomerase N-terminal domain-containing protein [Acidimicrobiales bacterium]
MARLPQFYGGTGVPLVVDADPKGPAVAWRSQRARTRAWLDSLVDTEWDGPTRCESWDTSELVRHMTSASQFLGYTLRQAIEDDPTTLLQGMDTRTTVADAAAMLGELEPGTARVLLASTDAAVDSALTALDDAGWSAIAEAPPGHMPADLVLSHFLFDSWVHEYDLLVPRGEQPVVEDLESEVVLRYLVGLASVTSGSVTALELRATEPELLIGVTAGEGATTVTVGAAHPGAAVIEGRVADIVDRTSGREAGPVGGDPAGLSVLDEFSLLLAT